MICRLREVLASVRLHHATEADLQAGIATVLDGAGVAYEREAPVTPRDRRDFLLDDAAVEVKVGGGLADALRQLDRYAASDRVRELVLVTTRMTHRAAPPSLRGGARRPGARPEVGGGVPAAGAERGGLSRRDGCGLFPAGSRSVTTRQFGPSTTRSEPPYLRGCAAVLRAVRTASIEGPNCPFVTTSEVPMSRLDVARMSEQRWAKEGELHFHPTAGRLQRSAAVVSVQDLRREVEALWTMKETSEDGGWILVFDDEGIAISGDDDGAPIEIGGTVVGWRFGSVFIRRMMRAAG